MLQLAGAGVVGSSEGRRGVESAGFLERVDGILVPAAEKRARARFEASYSVGQCLAAVNRVFEVGGAGVLDSGKLCQHYMRGLMGMRNHLYAVFENWAGLYATTLFGLPLDPPFTKEHLGCLV